MKMKVMVNKYFELRAPKPADELGRLLSEVPWDIGFRKDGSGRSNQKAVGKRDASIT